MANNIAESNGGKVSGDGAKKPAGWWSWKVWLFYLACILAILISTQASAMKSPGAILWKHSPEAFVTSLYRGVLGREPESRDVVHGWAQQAQTVKGRWEVFWRFVNSPEYRGKFGGLTYSASIGSGAGGRGDWTVYYRRNRWNTDYTVAQQIPNGYHGAVYSPYKFSVAIALRNFLTAYYRENPTYR